MKVIFAPGVALLNRLRYPHKFLLIGTLFLVPLLLLGYLLIQEVNERINFMEQERPGIEYIAQLREIIQPMQQHRGMSAAILGGDNRLRDELTKQAANIDQALVKLQQLDQRYSLRLETGSRFASLEHDWLAIKQGFNSLSQAQSFQRHTVLITNMLEFIHHLANTSNLILASKMDTYYLVDTLVNHLPKLAEDTGQSRALGSAIIVEGKFTSENWQQLLGASQRIAEAEKNLLRGIQAVLHENPSLTSRLQQPADKVFLATNTYSTSLKKMLEKDEVTANLDQFFNQATQTIDSIFSLFDLVTPSLDGLLTKRIADYKLIRTTTLGVMLLVLVTIVYIFIAFYLSVINAIIELRAGIEKIAAGDLTTHIKLATRDETHLIAIQANAMAQQFRELVNKVIDSTQLVAAAADQLAETSEKTNQGLNEQKLQTDQVATAMNEMSATVQEVALSAASTLVATHSAQQEVNTGNEVVTNTVQTINALASEIQAAAALVHKLGEDSNAIGKVVDVIRGIADQTNLLALNAAIEAARAGEQGRGFAVVADEVRTLASRTQQSTQEIQQMIEQLQAGAQKAMQAMQTSESRTNEGVTKAVSAGQSLESIHSSVTTITDMSAQIASAAEQQSAVAEEINRNIIEIADIADINSAASNQTATSSAELSRLSNDLKRMVAVFNV
ncbi:MAG: methyl-accepting chemotaxis protein [Pseudomonadaceae bacterium]|nr:methyl-accepting chemotaxis protein [Pseudomonadaceae bacterium]